MDPEERHYRDEHFILFGHYPIPDLQTGRKCGHEVHKMLSARMRDPGMTLEIPFDPQSVITEDDDVVLAWQKRQQDEKSAMKQVVNDLEEQQAFLDRPVNEKKRLF